jgi:hypothetical protein
LTQLATKDQEENQLADDRPIKEKIDGLKKKLSELKALEDEINNQPDNQISTTDPDSRLLVTQGQTRAVCYNVQSAVDTKHHLIVTHEVTNTVDRNQLCRIAKKAQDAVGKKEITVIADKGYYSGTDIKDTQDAGMTPLVPKGDTSGSDKKGIFNRSRFEYDAGRDRYICPAKQELPYRHTAIERGLMIKRYWAYDPTCRACSMKPQCSNSQQPRRITRWIHQKRLEKMEQQLSSMPESVLIRKQTVEHPFGTIKCWMGSTHFLTRQFKNVRTEMSLHVLAYNLKRMMSILGSEKLIAAMTA